MSAWTDRQNGNGEGDGPATGFLRPTNRISSSAGPRAATTGSNSGARSGRWASLTPVTNVARFCAHLRQEGKPPQPVGKRGTGVGDPNGPTDRRVAFLCVVRHKD